MLALLSTLGAYRRLLVWGGTALAVVLTLFGFYRKGKRAAQYAEDVHVTAMVRRNLKESQEVQDEIRQRSLDDALYVVNRLRGKWKR